MENTETSLLDVSLTIDTQSDRYLRETAKWNKFLAILCFIFGGLIILGGLYSAFSASFTGRNSSMAYALGGGVVVFLYISILATLTILPNIYRFRFASQVLQALDTNDQVLLTSSFGNLKTFFRFYSIIIIVLIAFYVFAIFAIFAFR
ncbi:hypothetical protein [Pinibacter aurantiacus]|uniref:DUF5362 domain-containing protein n=1 Tax=Pinibacter aurantiacus TaxID=2851599 RepID=A0A9E2W3P5_9BACT|nr:hypothetical protein [Pinibacter aurantiacus]MBV4357019.1 hypothetical protein [Pinibacter aurantiacus]